MRYRALDENGDYEFGHGSSDFLVNSPSAVGQAVLTRLKLWLGEWFIDPADGTPWLTEITGAHTQGVRDMAIKQRILGTQGVASITSYSSFLDIGTRQFSVTVEIGTIYGLTSLTSSVNF